MDRLLKKTILLFTMFCILTTAFAGCAKRETGSQESAAPESSALQPEDEASQPAAIPGALDSGSSYTDEEAAANNASLPEVELIQFQNPKPGQEIAVMTTSMGTIKLMLFREQAPKTVENFVVHAKSGYYNGLSFHRVINGFMIQSGDPEGNGTGGHSIYKDAEGNYVDFACEFSLDLWNFRGALSMARTKDPVSNGSQFFIVQAPKVSEEMLEQMRAIRFPQKVIDKYAEVGGTPSLDWQYTVFGMVLEGMEVVDAIAAVPTDPDTNKPLEPVIVENIVIETA